MFIHFQLSTFKGCHSVHISQLNCPAACIKNAFQSLRPWSCGESCRKTQKTAQSSHEKIESHDHGSFSHLCSRLFTFDSIKWSRWGPKVFFLDHVRIVEELGYARMNWKCQPCLFASHFLTQFCCHNKRHPQTCRPMWHPADLLRSCLASKATWLCKGYSSKTERMKHTLMLLTPSLITKGTRKALTVEFWRCPCQFCWSLKINLEITSKIHLESWIMMNLGLTEFSGSCYARHPGTSTSQVPTCSAGCRRRSVTWPWMPQCVVWGNKSHIALPKNVFFFWNQFINYKY